MNSTIAVSTGSSSILICDFLHNSSTFESKITYASIIPIEEISSISNLIVKYNTYRNSSFIFVDGQDQGVVKQLLMYKTVNDINIYNVTQTLNNLKYATSYNRWLFKILNRKFSSDINVISKQYDYTLQNDDCLKDVIVISNLKNISVLHVDTNISYTKVGSFSHKQGSTHFETNNFAKINNTKHEGAAFNLELKNNPINFNTFNRSSSNKTGTQS